MRREHLAESAEVRFESNTVGFRREVKKARCQSGAENGRSFPGPEGEEEQAIRKATE